jgi:hypothetical protein
LTSQQLLVLLVTLRLERSVLIGHDIKFLLDAETPFWRGAKIILCSQVVALPFCASGRLIGCWLLEVGDAATGPLAASAWPLLTSSSEKHTRCDTMHRDALAASASPFRLPSLFSENISLQFIQRIVLKFIDIFIAKIENH